MRYTFIIAIILVFVVTLLPLACGPAQYTLHTSVSPEGAGTITPDGGTYKGGTEVTLVAEPASGYAFDYWSGDVLGITTSITITMDSDKSVSAHFKALYTLSTSVSPSKGGTVSPASGTYDTDTKLTLTANAAGGYKFDCWSGDASGISSSVAVTMDRNKNIVAHFKEASRPISAQEAQQAVQTTLNVMGSAINIEGLPGPQLPNGVEVPKNAKAGTPTLVDVNGVPAWKVPVLTSSGVRVGEIYVKQIQSTPNRVEFINFGQGGPTGVETEYGTYR